MAVAVAAAEAATGLKIDDFSPVFPRLVIARLPVLCVVSVSGPIITSRQTTTIVRDLDRFALPSQDLIDGC